MTISCEEKSAENDHKEVAQQTSLELIVARQNKKEKKIVCE